MRRFSLSPTLSTYESQSTPSLDYLAGLISANGSFFTHSRCQRTDFIFQFKLPAADRAVLEAARERLGLPESVRSYSTGPHQYSVLVVRSRRSISNILIPLLDGRLFGTKRAQFDQWRDQFYRLYLSKPGNVSHETTPGPLLN